MRKEEGIKKYKTIPIDTTKIHMCRKTYHLTATIQHHPLPFSNRVGEKRTRHVTPPADDDLSIYLLLDYIFECFIYPLFSVFQLVFFEVM